LIFRKMIILLLIALMLGGCVKREIIPPDPLTQNILSAIANAVSEDDVLSALVQINLVTLQGTYPVRAALVVKKPSYLRLELLPLVGTPDFFLTITPQEMKILLPAKGEFYHGKPTGDNLSQFLPWKFNIDEIVAILLSSYPPLSGEPVSYQSYSEENAQRIEMNARSGKSQTIWLGKNNRLIKIIRRDESGSELYTVVYKDYKEGTPVAGKVTINMADGATSMEVKYSDPKIEKNKDTSIFDLPAPVGFKSIMMDLLI
jgi:outer membrane lipoprotein-sorting protein